MESLIKFVQDEFVTKKEIPNFKSGDTITVYYEIREGEKVRTQFFKGVVIQIKGTGLTKTFTIRKMSGTIGIERIFPFNLPAGKLKGNILSIPIVPDIFLIVKVLVSPVPLI